MLLPTPPHTFVSFAIALGTCWCIGKWCPLALLSTGPDDPVYIRAGEYGETEIKRTWSVYKEPFNAWTSLAYSVFGLVICCVGARDGLVQWGDGPAPNRITVTWAFSVLYGLACFYLGVASFLFHASHSERWRKADAGMTSGVLIPALVSARLLVPAGLF
jgi:hypothetical protein